MTTQKIEEGSLLWTPSADDIANANITHLMGWLAENKGLQFDSYPALWQWSADDLPAFWGSMWEYFEIKASQQHSAVLGERSMPGAEWFIGARLNYAENIFQRMTDGQPMALYKAENSDLVEVSWADTYDQVNRLAAALREMGVQRGDRVVAFLSNIPEAIVGLLATASLGAIWSSCSPDFGGRSVLDRFSQIEPKVLLAVDGYNYGGKSFDRRSVVAELQANLPSLQHTILVPKFRSNVDGLSSNTSLWEETLGAVTAPSEIQFEQVPFDHPLWVLYSSGTTGLPKPIVHGHGGIILEHAKALAFHNDIKPEDRFFWYSSTGWMMWNYLVGSLLTGCTVILYDGSPGYPDMNALWILAEETGMTYFGTSAAYVGACIKAGITPNREFDLSRIRAVGSTGSPLSVAGFQWIYENVNEHLALESLSGGTDLGTALLGGARTKPIFAGEMQCVCLGTKVAAFDESGQAVIDEVGELVITEPLPTMPLYFWNDPENKRYQASYYDMFPGIWRHGDWIKITDRGGCIIYGRSDSTINRHGVRMGTGEIYAAVEALPEIADSLVIDLEMLGRESYLPMFVVLREGAELDDALRERIRDQLRTNVSPRHVPDDIFAIAEVPYTLSGKKIEVPIRKILLGLDVAKAANPGAMRNPESIKFFVEFAEQLR